MKDLPENFACWVWVFPNEYAMHPGYLVLFVWLSVYFLFRSFIIVTP